MRSLFKAAAAETEAPPRESVGAVLRNARIATGRQLPDVAAMLRIRLPYLQAIEDGRYGDLPGAAYALGFLRSYAEHLGLDPDAVARAYKDETAGRDTKQELYLPTPAAEGRMPGGALLFGALVLAGAVYGGWYYTSATDRSIVDATPALPDRLVALLEGLPWRSGGASKEAVPASPSAPASVAAPAPVPAVPPAPAAPQPASAAHTAPAPAAALRPGAAQLTAAAPPPAAASAPPVVAFKPPEAEEEEGSANEPTPLAPNAGALSQSAPPPVDLPPLSGKSYGAPNGGSRIQLRATQETWLQVRDRSGEIIFTRTLKTGDIYRAPDRPGLKIRTGNAGGLVVVTDGVIGQPMGAEGQVLRDVTLDAPSLRGAGN
jgi:cytoskeleton protein RodZ